MARILSRYVLSISAAAALLGGCSGASQPIAAAPGDTSQLRAAAQAGLGEARLLSKAGISCT